MDNVGYEINGLSFFDNNPVDTAINENPDTVKVYGNQTIGGNKVFTGTVTIEDEIIHNSTSFSTEDGIIEQLKGNTGDMLDYGNYGVYNDGTSTKYKGIINKKQTDKFYVFHNQTNQPVSSLNLGTQDLGSLVVRDPVDNNEVATKQYVESHGGGSYLPLSGGTLSGNVNMGNNEINNLKDLRFGDDEVYNDIIFPVSNRLTIGEHGDNFFMHFNAIGANELIEIMKETNIHGDIHMLNAKRIFGLLNPLSNDEPANKSYADTKFPFTGGIITGDFGFTQQQRQLLLAGKSGGNSTPQGNFITTLSNNDLVIYKGLKYFALNNNECYTNQRLNMSNNKIIGVVDGTDAGDAVNRSQLDTKLNLSGGSMQGDLSLQGNNLFNVNEVNLAGNNGRFVYFTTGGGAGTNIQSAQANNTIYFSPHASTSKTLNLNTLTKLSSFFGNIDMNNNKITNVSNGSVPNDAVNYQQLQSKLSLNGGVMDGNLDFSNDITMTTPISGDGKIRIGLGGAPTNKGNNTVAIGSYSGQENQGMGAVAIGAAAGFGSQGANAIAIGNLAGYTGSNGTTSQASNSILLNATGTNYTTGQTNSFNVKPIRNSNSNDKILKYNPTTGEITYHNDMNLHSVQKMAVDLNNVTTSSNVGSHTFEFDEPLTDTTTFLITIDFNEEYTGTFANSSKVTVDYSFRNISNGITSQTSKSFYPFVKDIGGGEEFISHTFKVLLDASITTQKLVVDIDDGYTTGTKTYNHIIEVEQVRRDED